MPIGGGREPLPWDEAEGCRYAAWFHELDAWTEYWDIYHRETRGRFYFGNGGSELGLLTNFLPRETRPPPFVAWTGMALGLAPPSSFAVQVADSTVAAAILEVDQLVARLFAKHFGDAADPAVQADYIEAMFRFGTHSLPPATERYARIPADDWRKRTSGEHAIDNDIMWFAWALHTEAAHIDAPGSGDQSRRALQLAGVAVGSAADFTWRGHRRTRPEYRPDKETATLLRERGARLAQDFDTAANEVHALFRIREWGHE